MIYLQTGGERLVFLDGTTQVLKWEPGEVKWSPAFGFHYSDGHWQSGSGSPPIYVALKKPGYPGDVVITALDPLRVDPKVFTLEFENPQVRVLHVRMGPRQSVPMHEYSLDHFVVYVTNQNVRETSPEGKAEVAQHKAAEFSWSGPSKQRVDNLNDGPFEAVVVEVKTIY
jgi:hypothetical protein